MNKKDLILASILLISMCLGYGVYYATDKKYNPSFTNAQFGNRISEYLKNQKTNNLPINLQNEFGINFRNITIDDVDFTDVDLSGLDFSGSIILRSKFIRSNLEMVQFNRSTLRDCDFSDSKMSFTQARNT